MEDEPPSSLLRSYKTQGRREGQMGRLVPLLYLVDKLSIIQILTMNEVVGRSSSSSNDLNEANNRPTDQTLTVDDANNQPSASSRPSNEADGQSSNSSNGPNAATLNLHPMPAFSLPPKGP